MHIRSLLAVCALFLALLVPLAGARAVAGATGMPQIQLSTSVVSAAGGTPVTVSGTGFAANSPITVVFNNASVGSTTANSVGNFGPITVTIPSAPPGTYSLQVNDGIQGQMVSQSLYLSAITISTTSGAPGSSVTVSGQGLPPNAQVAIALGNQIVAQAVTNGGGALAATTFTVPSLPSGAQTLQVEVQANGTQVAVYTATFTVQGAAIAVTPLSVTAGSTVQLTGSGLPNGTTLTVNLDSAALTTLSASNGAISTALTIPAGTPAGAHQISVLANGQVLAVTTISVAAATPATLSLTPQNGPTGSTVTAAGQGFTAGEQVTLSITGNTVATATATASSQPANQGQFSVQFTVPQNLAAGAVTVLATGASSHLTASAAFTVTTPAAITLSPASATAGTPITVSGQGFAAGEQVTLSLAGNTVQTAGATAQGTFQIQVTVPSSLAAGSYPLAAQGQSSHLTATATLTVTAAVAPQITLSPSTVAAGTSLQITGTGFAPAETVQIALNGQPSFAQAVAGGNGSFAVTVTVPSTLGAGSYQLRATGMTSRVTAQATVQVSAPVSPTPTPVPPVSTAAGSTTWYFAAGHVGGGYSEQLALLNPNAQAVQGTITLYYAGYQTRSVPFTLQPHARSTYHLEQILGVTGSVAALVQANAPIAAGTTVHQGILDRMSTAGVPQPSRTWYVAEGYTGLTFQEHLDLFNPGSVPAQVQITWPLFNGRPPVVHSVTVAPRSRLTIPVNQFVIRASHSPSSPSRQPIVAARTLYFGTRHQGADSKEGVAAPSTTLYFAEGSTANGFQEYLTILNPSTSVAAQVTAHFYSRTGQLLGTRTITIDPMHRGNIKVNNVVTYDAIATVLQSTQPIVAERAMYFGAPNSAAAGGTDVFGSTQPALGWAFANGDTLPGRAEFELLFNPNNTASTVQATYYAENGQMVQQMFTVGPHTRMNIDLNLSIHGLPKGYHGVILQSTNNVPFFAEQAIYTDNITFGGATTGTPIQ